MNNIQIQEQSLYKLLLPVFQDQGYELLKSKNQFRKITPGGFRSVLFSLSGQADEQVLDLQFGVRFNIIETLVQQFLGNHKSSEPDSNTILASLHHLKRAPIRRFPISDMESLQRACNEISVFMQEKGFRFLKAYDSLKRVDATINRKPQLPSPYMYNQLHRCFKGIAIARLLQRNDFERLITIYSNHLYSQRVPAHIMENFNRLVNYLRYFSFN